MKRIWKRDAPIQRIIDSGVLAIPIMYVAGGIVWVWLCLVLAAIFS